MNRKLGTPIVTREKRIGILIFLILLTCYAYFPPRWADWNQNSRLNLVMAIVDRGELNIDHYIGGFTSTGDYAAYGDHLYSTKAPGSAFLGVPVYWVYQRFLGQDFTVTILGAIGSRQAFLETLNAAGTGLLPEKLQAAIALSLLTLVLVSIPSALLGVALYAFCGKFNLSRRARIAAVLLYGLATTAFPYSGAYYGHQIVAVLLFLAFYLAFLIDRSKRSPVWGIAVGLMLSFAVITEYPAVIVAIAIALYLLLKRPSLRTFAYMVLGASPPAFLWMGYNMAIFGKPIAFGYLYAPLFKEVNTAGFFSLVGPRMEAFWGITFSSYRGLFFLSPILLLTIPGFMILLRRRIWRAETMVSLWAFLGFFIFNMSSLMWDGGYAVGPRYLVPMLPFLVLPLATCLESCRQRKGLMIVAGLLALWSLFTVWVETLGGQQFPDYARNPLFEYSLPRLSSGDFARNAGTILGLPGWLSLIPLLTLVGAMLGYLILVLAGHEMGGSTSAGRESVRTLS